MRLHLGGFRLGDPVIAFGRSADGGVLFLSIGIGAIVQVVVALHRMVARQSPDTVWTPLIAGGLMAGLMIMYAMGLFVAL